MAAFDQPSPVFDASVERTGSDAVRLSWKTRLKNLRISIYHGNSPETIDRTDPFLQIKGQTAADISGLNPDLPHYF